MPTYTFLYTINGEVNFYDERTTEELKTAIKEDRQVMTDLIQTHMNDVFKMANEREKPLSLVVDKIEMEDLSCNLIHRLDYF